MEIPSGLSDVHDGVPITDARTTLKSLGFKPASPVRVKSEPDWVQESSILEFWYHPKGLAFAGWVAENGELYNARMSAVIDVGWGEPPVMNGVRPTTWECEDGTSILNFNSSLDRDRKTTLLGLLGEMKQKEVMLGGFVLWAEQAKKEMTGSWLFCVGNEALGRIAADMGLSKWLHNAPEPLIEYVRRREDHITGRVRMNPSIPSWGDRLGRAFRQVGVGAGQSHPTANQKKQFMEWMRIGTGELPWKRDWHVQEGTGLMLPHVLALMSTETRAQDRLLMWCRQAPEKFLRQAFIDPHCSGCNVVTRFVVRGGIQGSLEQHSLGKLPQGRANQSAPAASMSIAAQSLEIISERTGNSTVVSVQEALQEIEGLLSSDPGTLSGAATEGFVQKLLEFLESIHHLEIGSRAKNGDATPPPSAEYWKQRLEAVARGVPWTPLVARLQEWEMETAIPPAPTGKSPRGAPKTRF